MARKTTVLAPERSKAYSSDGHAVEIDPSEVATLIGKKVAEHHREAIRAGRKPSGGSQRSLGPSERKRAAAGKREPDRGMGQDGAFAGSIRSTKARGSSKASSRVAADAYFDEWLTREAGRGVDYIETDGDVESIVDSILLDMLDEQLT